MKNVTVFVMIILFLTACKKDDLLRSNSQREEVIQDYKANYLGTEIKDPGWTGDINNCTAGTVSLKTTEMVIKRINYFRRLVGLNDNTTLDQTKSNLYQEAALVMSANLALSHNPPNTWKCWTPNAFSGAASSNLALGVHSTKAVSLFIEDGGSNNVDVGHRRWILHSKKSNFSFGSTHVAMSLGVIGMEDNNQNIPPFIAYPPNGYCPKQLVFPRWSFSKPNANFTNATITMNGPDGNIPLNIISRKQGYGDNSIVWEPQKIDLPVNSEDVTYRITVNNIANSTQSLYSYDVIIINIQ